MEMQKAVVTDISGRDGFRTVRYEDNKIYVIKPFRGKQGTKLSMTLAKYASGAFGGILVGVVDQIAEGTDVEKMDTIGLMISGVLEGAFSELDDPKFQDFFFELFSNVVVDGSPLDYDKEFQLDFGLPFDLVRHIVTYNFASVFQRLGIGALLKKKVAEAEAQPNRG